MSTFKDQLQAALADRGWKPVQLAAAMSEAGFDVPQITIERWVEGANEPRYTTGRLALAIATGEELQAAANG